MHHLSNSNAHRCRKGKTVNLPEAKKKGGGGGLENNSFHLLFQNHRPVLRAFLSLGWIFDADRSRWLKAAWGRGEAHLTERFGTELKCNHSPSMYAPRLLERGRGSPPPLRATCKKVPRQVEGMAKWPPHLLPELWRCWM